MRADLTRRLDALEEAAARRRQATPPSHDMPDFAAMTIEELDRWLADPPPLAGGDDMPDFAAMSDEALDAYLADQCGPASGDATTIAGRYEGNRS